MNFLLPDVLVYDRTQYLIDMVRRGETDPNQYFAATNATVYATGDGTPVVFVFNLSSAWYNAEDLNRIEDWTKWLADMLDYYGYHPDVTFRDGLWQDDDLPTRSDIDRIRSNVDALQTGFASLPDWREIVYNNTMGWEQANAIEWDLSRIYVWLGRMVSAFWYAGEIYAGEV